MTTKPAPSIRTDPKYAHIKPLPDPPQKWDGMQESRFIFSARFIIERRFQDRNDVLVNGYGYLCHHTHKRQSYANLGVQEYWRFDHTGGKLHDRPLAGDLLQPNGRYQPVEMRPGSDGITRGYSPTLGLELCWHNGRLRFYDPQTGQFLPDEKETAALADAAQAKAPRLREELCRRNNPI